MCVCVWVCVCVCVCVCVQCVVIDFSEQCLRAAVTDCLTHTSQRGGQKGTKRWVFEENSTGRHSGRVSGCLRVCVGEWVLACVRG